jgi:exodeoxyribonuclease-3
MPRLLQVKCASFYHLATPALAAGAQSVDIYKGEKFSDHAPITVEYAW